MLTPIQIWPIIATFLNILSLKSATTEYVNSYFVAWRHDPSVSRNMVFLYLKWMVARPRSL